MASIDLNKLKKQTNSHSESTSDKLGKLLSADISFGGTKLSDKKKERFYNQLSVLLKAGVDIKTTFEIFVGEQTNEKDKKLFEGMQQALIGGKSLSELLSATGYFSAYEYQSVRLGEESGTLPDVLADIANYFKNKIKQRRQIISSLTYPAIVITTSIGTLFFMLNFIVPMFGEVFSRFGGKLPALTQNIIYLSGVFSQVFPWIMLLLFSIIIAAYSQRNEIWFRKAASYTVLKLPIAGSLVQKIYLARFSQSMALLIASKVPMIRALELVEKMLDYYPISSALPEIRDRIVQGDTLHHALSKYAIFPKTLVSLIKVGEEVNQLNLFFKQTAERYLAEAEHETSVMASLLEPFVIIFLGAVVGIILVAMYLPLFQISSGFGF